MCAFTLEAFGVCYSQFICVDGSFFIGVDTFPLPLFFSFFVSVFEAGSTSVLSF